MDKETFKERLIGGDGASPILVDAEWDEGRTGVITLSFQRPGEPVYRLRIGTSCGDPYPELIGDPAVRRRLLALPDNKQAQVARVLGFDPEDVPYPQFAAWLFEQAWLNDKLDELEELVCLAEPEGKG